MQRGDWQQQQHAGSGQWSSTREAAYQQRKFLQKPIQRTQHHGQQLDNTPLYGRWNGMTEEYPRPYPIPMYRAADGNGYYRRYSLDAPPESFIYYNTKRSFIDQSLENDDITPTGSTNTLLYPSFVDDDEPLAPASAVPPFYFKQKRHTKSATTTSTLDANIINTEQVVHNLTLFGRFLEVVQSWPLPRVSFTTACILVLLATFISPRIWAENIIFPAFRLSFGTLYPAYASYKAVRTKNVKEYVKWMMYWIVYAFFTCIETFTDIFLAWFPFYYEVKVIIVLWLLSPATKGSSTLYRKFVHPMLTRREQEIDEYLNQAKERGYSAVLQLGTKGVNYATNVIMQTALKGGGNLVQTIRRSYSLSDLSEPDVQRTQDEIDDVVQMRSQQRMLRPRPHATSIARSASGTRHSTGMYFSEVDVVKGADDFNYNIRSSEDISSGYSSAEPVSVGLSRTSSMTNASKTRLKAKRTEMFNEPQPQFRPTKEQIYFPNSAAQPRVALGPTQNEIFANEFEVLKEPAAFDVRKCIQIIEEMPQEIGAEKTEADNAKETNEANEILPAIDPNSSFDDEFNETIEEDQELLDQEVTYADTKLPELAVPEDEFVIDELDTVAESPTLTESIATNNE
ncbi:uncharacterized protein LOC101453424 isoform X3 [Ceratitis capitata]|nr:uncharacterized protein LOC101453424 isoform X3 [Ceratitis capitata]